MGKSGWDKRKSERLFEILMEIEFVRIYLWLYTSIFSVVQTSSLNLIKMSQSIH